MTRFPVAFLLAIAALAASSPGQSQTVRPGSVVRIDSVVPSEPPPSRPDPAFRPAERDRAMGQRPPNGCDCESNNRCYHSLDFNYCIGKKGERVYLQRFWGQ
jgi:hypothetical protein